MRFGCCIGRVDQLPAVQNADLDYLEVAVGNLVMATGAEDFEQLRGVVRSGPPVLAANVLLPSSVRLLGSDTDRDQVLAYVRDATERLRLLAVRLVVFGSGGPRRIPDGYERARALGELAEFCRQAAGITQAADITLVLEPLRRAESNVWNSVGEVAAFIRDHRLEGVRLLADLYHMREEGEPVSAVTEHADLLAHTHVAGVGRTPPAPDPELSAFLAAAQQARSDLTCSIECRWNDLASELAPALRTLRGT